MPSIKDSHKRAHDVYSAVAERAKELKLKEGQKRSSKVTDRLSEESLFFDELQFRLEKTLKDWKKPAQVKKPNKAKKQPVANLLLSDLHFGSMLGAEVVFPFGALEESRRLASVVEQTIQAYGEQTDRLNVYILGDVIQNQLHDARDGAPLAAQACAAIDLLGQALQALLRVFPDMNVYCSTGNHGRFTSRHHGRAIHQKWDSLEHVVYFALERMFQGSAKVHFNKSHFVHSAVSGHEFFATHGDTVLNVGSPNKSVNVRGVEGLLGRLNGNFSNKVKIFLCGHTHSPTMHVMSNGVWLIMNGALVPSDEFAATQGWLTTASGQWGWLTSEQVPVYDTRFHIVGPEQDKNPELNKIISPHDY